jgi:hypothetical protein
MSRALRANVRIASGVDSLLGVLVVALIRFKPRSPSGMLYFSELQG